MTFISHSKIEWADSRRTEAEWTRASFTRVSLSKDQFCHRIAIIFFEELVVPCERFGFCCNVTKSSNKILRTFSSVYRFPATGSSKVSYSEATYGAFNVDVAKLATKNHSFRIWINKTGFAIYELWQGMQATAIARTRNLSSCGVFCFFNSTYLIVRSWFRFNL